MSSETIAVTMPKLGLTMASGTIARWHKAPGDALSEGEPLLEVTTDKINYEVPAPASGTLASRSGEVGQEFACGEAIATIATGAGRGTASGASNGDGRSTIRGGRVVASPAARRLARERGVSLAEVRGTGPRGRITLDDVPSSAAGSTNGSAKVATTAAASARSTAALEASLSAQRRTLFRRMTEAAMVPLAYVHAEASVEGMLALRKRRRDFGLTAFAAYACARVLQDHPDLRTDARTGRPFERCDVAIAVDTPHGLQVPVVRDATTLGLGETAREVRRLIETANAGTLGSGDVGEASFAISNVGPLAVDGVLPLVVPPQTAILGLGAVVEKPAVRDGAVVVERRVTCAVGFDHRFIDGAPATRFLAAFVRALGDPGALL